MGLKKRIKLFSGTTFHEIETEVNEFIVNNTTGNFDAKFTESVNSVDNAYMDACVWTTILLIYEPVGF